MDTQTLAAELLQILQDTFHFNQFRAGQLEAITALLQHGRLLCIQPTGHGKSLLYQLPSCVLPGMTIVVSPLLALMRDQIGQLNQRFQIRAASINSDQSLDENNSALHAARDGKLKILFIAPEKLDHLDYFQFLLSLPISLIVIDEAHCISTWGHDFRPSYRQIIHFIRALEANNHSLKVLAITATANTKTESDITQQLTSKDQAVILHRHNMDRPNLKLSVIPTFGHAAKLATIFQLLEQLPGNGLIYCATRENTELVAEYLQRLHIPAAAYHAGLEADRKRELQQHFQDNQYKIIAATNALGMGIDKQDLRFIIHFDLPGSITAYYQEVGRAGRDGTLAHGILLFDETDKKIQEYFIDAAQPTSRDFTVIHDCIANAETALDLTDIKRISGLHPTRVTAVIAELLEQAFVTKQSRNRKQIYQLTQKTGKPNLLRYENQYQTRTQELREMINYGKQSLTCLMKLLRHALGDAEAKPCDHCSICASSVYQVEVSLDTLKNITHWLNGNAPTISMPSRYKLATGISILNGHHRSPLFIDFMKSRHTAAEMNNSALLELLFAQLKILKNRYQFAALIIIPSRTWTSRDHTAKLIADFLNIPIFTDFLQWQKMPVTRQGELLNNDQRRHNVEQHMQHDTNIPLPQGDILLLDDYTGSGATIQEAARVLRKNAAITATIVPFTLAVVKWRLGKRGMI